MCLRNKIIFVSLIILFACAPVRVKTDRDERPPSTSTSKETTPDSGVKKKSIWERVFPGKTYEETVFGWRSYQDLVQWMEREFSTDMERYKKFEGTLPVPRTPEETFRFKSGIYIDAAVFMRTTLNRMDPSLKAQVLILIIRPNRYNHYVCSFNKDGRIFILDYGTPFKEITGIHGPYRSPNEYKKFYETHHPARRGVEAIAPLP
jgi:hypothetical protein